MTSRENLLIEPIGIWIIICPMKNIGRFLAVFVLLCVPAFAEDQ